MYAQITNKCYTAKTQFVVLICPQVYREQQQRTKQ